MIMIPELGFRVRETAVGVGLEMVIKKQHDGDCIYIREFWCDTFAKEIVERETMIKKQTWHGERRPS